VFRERSSLLKVGVAMMALALLVVIAAVVVSLTLGGESGRASEPARKSLGEPSPHLSGEEEGATESSPAGEASGYSSSQGKGGQETEERPAASSLGARPEAQQRAARTAGGESRPGRGQRTLPAGESGDWPRPSEREIEAANAPRHYHLLPGAIMSLTIQKIGIYGAPVFDSDGPQALASGIAHVPETSLPWSPTPERNVYLAGHRMGFRGTWSRMLFYELDELGRGDTIVLRDRSGRTYEYRVSETLIVEPSDRWVMGRVRGRDMVTLQTCTPIPTFQKRLIVRADRI
jgi:sortase A